MAIIMFPVESDFRSHEALLRPSSKSIVFMVADGLGGIPHPGFDDLTELAAANTPEFDMLTLESDAGLHLPVGAGITPGSVPAHLGIFGYDALRHNLGRGIVEALGSGVEIGSNDVAARCNWCTIDGDGNMIDRRAGRISTDESAPLIRLLQENISIPGVQVKIIQGVDYRFAVVFNGKNLGKSVKDTDPQVVGKPLLEAIGSDEQSQKTAKVANNFILQALALLSNQPSANALTMRGFSKLPNIPSFEKRYGLKALAIATHPLYLGIGKLLGMEVAKVDGKQPRDVVRTLQQRWGEKQFNFLHFKKPDSMGEDSNFEGKAEAIEAISQIMSDVRNLGPDVMVLTGDHSTPARLGTHSWHPVPLIIWSKHARSGIVNQFSEKALITGSLGPRLPAWEIMPEVLAHAEKLSKFGA